MPIAENRIWVSLVTGVVILLTVMAPFFVEVHGGYLSVALILLLGIPHGATDHILFRHIKKDYHQGWLLRFIVRYFLLMGLFALVWWILPSLALLIFLAISAYHFGQSQWHHLTADKISKRLIYFSWGLFILAAPLLWNYVETAPIIESLLGQEIFIATTYQFLIPVFLLGFVLLQAIVLFLREKIALRKLGEESAILLLLAALFYFTPLLVGFAIYFVFWHSFDSIKDQFIRLRAIHSDYTFKTYLLQVAPFTVGAFGGIGLFAWLSPAELMTNAWISSLFIMISIVTLPHSLLMDAFLETEIDEKIHQKNKLTPYRAPSRPVTNGNELKNFPEQDFRVKAKIRTRKYLNHFIPFQRFS